MPLSFVYGQIHEDFKLQRVNDNVYLSWTVIKGKTCNGIEVQRSIDSVNYFKIHDIQGVCGDLSKKIFYNYTDTSAVIDQRNYYRLKLGAIDLSEVKTIDLPENNGRSISIFPNPSDNEVQINFSEVSKFTSFSISSLDGKVLYEQNIENTLIETVHLPQPSGVYIFSFKRKNGAFKNYKVIKN